MKRHEYIKQRASIYYKLIEKREQITDKLCTHPDYKTLSKLSNELNFICADISMERERLGYALGFLTLDELTKEFNPSGFQCYKGIRGEIENIKFENEHGSVRY